jgi:ATP-dependent Clp protease adaptor protein ClpS
MRRTLVHSSKPMFGVLWAAERAAGERGHRPMTVHHVALGLLCDPEVGREIEARSIDVKAVYDDVERLLPERRPTPVTLSREDVDPACLALLRRIAPLGTLPPPMHVMHEVLSVGPEDLRRVLASHELTAKRWCTRHARAARANKASEPPRATSGPYRSLGADGHRAANVVLWNDPKTTMQFVTDLLRGTFGVVEPYATRAMLTTDREGRSIVGTYDEAEARRLTGAATELARARGYPLRITVERVGGPRRRALWLPWRTPESATHG